MHVETKPIRKYPWYLRPFFWNQKRKYGRVLIPGLVWGRVPRLFATMAMLYGVIDRRKSPIDPALRSLLTVRISQLNWCAFCVDINSVTLEKRGVSWEKIRALPNWKESDLFDEREKICLDYAEAVTLTEGKVTPDLVGKLKTYFDDDGLVDLTGLIAFQNLSSKFNNALDVPAQGFCEIPPSVQSSS